MRIILQNSDPRHLAIMAESLAERGDLVNPANTLEEASDILLSHASDGMILELSPEAVAMVERAQAINPALRAVFITPRAVMGEALASYPNLSILPAPGTAVAARFLLAENPAEDPACQLGDHQLEELDALDQRTHIFRAVQRSIARPVVLRLLNQEMEYDADEAGVFLENARAKAAVTHDRVGTVFQALQDHGAIFYTAEAMDGQSLAEMSRRSQHLSPKQLLEITRTLASALAHFATRQLASAPIELRHIYISGASGAPKLANQATSGAIGPDHHAAQFLRTLALVLPMLDTHHAQAASVRTWAGGLLQRPANKLNLDSVVAEARSMLGELDAPAHASEQTPAAGSKSPRTAVIAIASIVLVCLAGFLVNRKPAVVASHVVPDLETTITYSGGNVQHPDKGPITLAAFNLDKYEVTIGQYAQFLESIGSAPSSRIAHPDQATTYPNKKHYKPKDWDIWYPLALAGQSYEGHMLSLDCPVFNVDWWDAQAYARWKNRRLPSEDEWEFAAGATEWKKYPWGDTWEPARANGVDKPAPLAGHDAWCPVDLPEGDASPQGTHGLAGGVSEWTNSLTVHPEFPDRNIPVVKGGSFLKNFKSGDRVRILSHNEQKPWLGFRTAADQK